MVFLVLSDATLQIFFEQKSPYFRLFEVLKKQCFLGISGFFHLHLVASLLVLGPVPRQVKQAVWHKFQLTWTPSLDLDLEDCTSLCPVPSKSQVNVAKECNHASK